MQENKIAVVINRPLEEVFLFTITPSNTPLWILSIAREETNEWPVKVGSIYKNAGTDGHWSEYLVTDIQDGRLFELFSNKDGYHVRYTYSVCAPTSTHLEYFEWMDEGNLKDPFKQSALDDLKRILEMQQASVPPERTAL